MSHSIWQIYHSLTIISSNLLNWLCQASFLLSIMINQYLSKRSLNFTRWRLRLKDSKTTKLWWFLLLWAMVKIKSSGNKSLLKINQCCHCALEQSLCHKRKLDSSSTALSQIQASYICSNWTNGIASILHQTFLEVKLSSCGIRIQSKPVLNPLIVSKTNSDTQSCFLWKF